MSTTILLENVDPMVKQNGLNTNKTITLAGAANFDMSASTGAFKAPLGGITGSNAVVSGSGATATLTAAQSRSLVLFDRAAGIIFTLPTPVVGLSFTFLVKTSVTSNNYKIITDAGTTLLTGSLVNVKTDLTTLFSIADNATHIAVTMNGTTTGGLVGTRLVFTCISTTQWLIEGFNLASGVIASPLAIS